MEVVAEVEMNSQKALVPEEGTKPVFCLPVMRCFTIGFLLTEEPCREYLADQPVESGDSAR